MDRQKSKYDKANNNDINLSIKKEQVMSNDSEKYNSIFENPYFERNNYFFGKLMTVRDFFAEQNYFNQKRWLLNRLIHGWGVVCGLDVDIQREANVPFKVVVKPGIALDCWGREILVPVEQKIPPGDNDFESIKEKRRDLAICLEYRECKTEPLQIPPIDCDKKDKGEFNRIRDSFKIQIRNLCDIVLPCTGVQYCPLEYNKANHEGKSINNYLDEQLRKGCPECSQQGFIVLALIRFRRGIPVIDTNFHRKLVYSNPVLSDLIRCFHDNFPHIIKINWNDFIKIPNTEVSWKDFVKKLEEGFTVWFNKPMNADTINKSTFLVSIITTDVSTAYQIEGYIPATKIEYVETNNEYKASFKIITKKVPKDKNDWWSDVVTGSSRVKKFGGRCQIKLTGSHILEQKNKNNKTAKALDGEFIGGKLPSGNGSQGGDFISSFTINKA